MLWRTRKLKTKVCDIPDLFYLQYGHGGLPRRVLYSPGLRTGRHEQLLYLRYILQSKHHLFKNNMIWQTSMQSIFDTIYTWPPRCLFVLLCSACSTVFCSCPYFWHWSGPRMKRFVKIYFGIIVLHLSVILQVAPAQIAPNHVEDKTKLWTVIINHQRLMLYDQVLSIMFHITLIFC